MTYGRRAAWALLAVVLGLGVATAAATSGDLDSTFGGDGLVTASMNGSATLRALEVTSSGDVIAAGADQPNGVFAFTVRAWESDGDVATAFGTNGISQPFGTGLAGIAFDLAEASDGDLVVVGRQVEEITTGGKGKKNRGGGTEQVQRLAVVRLTSSGALDTDFGSSGVVLQAISGASDPEAMAVVVLSSGKILVAGNATVTTTSDDGGGGKGKGKKGGGGSSVTSTAIVLLRYASDGSLDTSFGTDGVVIDDVSTANDLVQMHGLAVASDGDIVVGGYVQGAGTGFLRRYSSNGTVDTGFGTDGTISFGAGDLAWGPAIAIDQNDDILVAGQVATTSTGQDGFVLRYDPDGSLDTSFGASGVFETGLSGDDGLRAVAVDASGNVVAAGTIGSPADEVDGFTLRLDPDGALDTTFGGDGYGALTTPIDGRIDLVYDLAMDGAGNLLIGGDSFAAGDSDLSWWIARICD